MIMFVFTRSSDVATVSSYDGLMFPIPCGENSCLGSMLDCRMHVLCCGFLSIKMGLVVLIMIKSHGPRTSDQWPAEERVGRGNEKFRLECTPATVANSNS